MEDQDKVSNENGGTPVLKIEETTSKNRGTFPSTGAANASSRKGLPTPERSHPKVCEATMESEGAL